MSDTSNQRISADVRLGRDVRIHGFVSLYGCVIGDSVRSGTFVAIQKGVTVGNCCKISSHSFLCEGGRLEDEVFIGHNVTFINDLYPCATNADSGLQTEADRHCEPTVVKRGASVGSGATILCGIAIGEGAVVGAGSMVTRDLPDRAVVAGNPARLLRWSGKVERTKLAAQCERNGN